MADRFLDIVKKPRGDGNYVANESGGGRGTDDSGTPAGNPGNFMFAAAIECFDPTIKNGSVRRALLEECGHCECFEEDLRLVKDLNLKVLRCGLPYYKINTAEGKYDREFAARAVVQP
jgi:hypothetical protein